MTALNGIMDFLAGMKDFFLQNGPIGLFVLAFAEASFFPIPPDIVLIPLAAAHPAGGLYYAGITSAASTLGGLFGYFIGIRAGRPLLSRFARKNNIQKIEDMFARYGGWAVGVAGFTPVPYKVFTIASGVFQMNIATFFIAALVSRSARFFLEGIIVMAMGENAATYLNKLLGPGSFLMIAAVLILYFAAKKSRISVRVSPDRVPGYGFARKTAEKYIAKYGEFGIYIIGGIITACIFGMMFAKLASEMLERELGWLDWGVIGFFKSIKNPAADAIMNAINFIQHPAALLMLLAAGIALVWFICKNLRMPVLAFISFAGSLVVQWGMKSMFQRPRLSPPTHLADYSAYGFPSGTALLFTAFVGFVAFAVTRKAKRRCKMAAAIFWLISTAIIGACRIYLGISYPTDILAGFLVGVVWMASCIVIGEIMEYLSAK
ncbi:MAG: VTT domain-containing protein [Tepidanaerobacteraceae bacterium]|nr:VTT domain-containing protein [Tepidanaerobacteraceae bacterium]